MNNRQERRKLFKAIKKTTFGGTPWKVINSLITKRLPYVNVEKRKKKLK